MRIALNRIAILGRKTGIGRYTLALAKHLKNLDEDLSLRLIPSQSLLLAANTFNVSFSLVKKTIFYQWFQYLKGTKKPSKWLRRIFLQQLQSFLSTKNFDLYHEPNYLPLSTELPTVITLHDLSVQLYPHWHHQDRVKRHEQQMPEILKRGTHFVTDSEYVRQQVVDHLHVANDKVSCVYPGIDPAFQRLPKEEIRSGLQKLGLKPDYILHVGSVEPRKNLLMLMQAFSALPCYLREKHPLVLAGPWGWRFEPIAEYFHERGKNSGVIHLGYVSERLLPHLYNGAKLLAFPSHYEGFGLPPLEMMACGGPVLASRIGSVQETLGPHAHMIHPMDKEGWRRALFRSLKDEEFIRSLKQRAGNLHRFRWENTAKNLYQVYQRVLGITLPMQKLEIKEELQLVA